MIKNVLKRCLSLLMIVLMVAAFIPQVVWAADLNTGITGLGASYDKGSWSCSGTTITGSVKTTTSSSCGSTSYSAVEGTLTLKNTSGSKATLLFSVTADTNDGVIQINENNAGSREYSFALAANDTVSVYIKSCDTAEKTTKVTLSNIQLISEKNVNITFVPSENGSYTVDGTVINNSKTITKKSTENFSLVATPGSGYSFAGWIVNNDPSNVISSESPASLVFTEDQTVSAYFVDNTVAVFDVAGKQFYNLNSAISYAQSNNKSKITLVTNGTISAGNYTIPSGITLLIPFDEAQTVYTATPAVVYGSHTMPTAFRTMTMAPGANITIQDGGSICCSGKLSSSGQMGGWNGTPTGPDGRIHMMSGSNITLNSGANLYCWGYIYGDGAVEAKSGSTVYEAFQIKDWRGGTATSTVYKYAFIFNQYYIQNIEVPLKLNAGAVEKLYSAVNASNSAYTMSATFMGNGGLFTVSEGYIIKDYIETTDRLQVDVYGTVNLSPMTLTGLPMIGSISTSDYILPITSSIGIALHSGTTSITQNIELLPSTRIVIDRDAALQINSGKKVYVYDNDDWLNFSGSARMYPIGYSVANGTTAVRSAADLKDAKIDVNGTLTVAGSLYTSNGGANITSSQGTEDTNGKIVFSTAPAASSTIYEMLNNSDKTAVTFYAPHLHNGDDSYSETVGTGTSTWYYDKDGEHWYRFLVDFVYNGKTVAKGYYCENNDTVTYDASWLTNLGASVTSGSASAAVSGTDVNVTNVTSNATVTLTGTAAQFVPTFVLNEKQYQNYHSFTGNTITETRTINDQTYYVVAKADAALAVGSDYAAPTDAAMGVTADKHNAIVWNLSGASATSGNNYAGIVPVGETAGGDAYIYGFYTGAVAYNSFTDAYYPTLAEAMEAVPSSGTGTVRLIADCGTYEEESGTAAFPSSADLTVDLNGHHALGRLINKGTMTLELNGGTWDYHTGATAAAAAYQGMAAVTNSGTLTIQDTVGGGKITADAISNAGVPNHSAVIRNYSGGTMSVSNVTLKNLQDVNGYVSVILNDRSTITSLNNVTMLSPRGYAIFNYGGHITTVDSCTIDCAYGIYNRNVRGNTYTSAGGCTIVNYGIIDEIKNSTITVGQYAIHNNAVITELNNCTFTAHPDSAQVNTYGTTASNVQGNVQCYTVYNNNAWWYDTNVWKRTDSGLTRTDEYKEDESYRPTIGTITDCRIYAENTSTSADYGCALYNNGGIIGTIGGNTEIKTYKHPDNAKSITSNYALRNTAGGKIGTIVGTVTISASGYSAIYNDGQFTTKTVNTYGDKIGGIQLHNTTTYGAPSTIETINCSGSISAGSYYGIMNSGKIGTITGGVTISANYNALLNSGAGASTGYEYIRTYTSNTDSTTETKREETYTRNLTDGSSIGTIDGVHFVGTGSNSYYLLQNQGKIGTLKNSDFTAASPKAGEGYAMFLNGDSRQSVYKLTRPTYAYDSLYITPYEYHYEYTLAPTIDEMDNVTISKNATYAFRNLGVINTLKNSTITGTQYVLVNTTTGPFVGEREYVRYYSGASKFSTTKNNGTDLTSFYTRIPAEIGTMDNNTITGTSTYALYNGGHLGTLTNNTISSTNTTVLFNGGATVRSFESNVLDIITEVTATSSACTVVYGNEAKVNTTHYDAPVIDLIGAGNKISGTYQVLVNLGTITAIDGGETPVEITASTQKQIGGIYSYTGTLDQRVATTPYTDGTAGSTTNADTYLSAHIGSIKNTVITANGIGIQNGSANANYLPVIDELGEGLEVNANCTTAGYHAVYNTTYAKIASITGGIYTAVKATTNAYRNNNPEHATLISGGDFKGMADTRDNAIFEPDNTNRQTYPAGKSLSFTTEDVTLHDGTSGTGYYFIGTAVTVTFNANGGTGSMATQQAAAGKAFTLNPNTFTRDNYTFDGWNTAADGSGTAYADQASLTLDADLTLYAQWKLVHVHSWGEPEWTWAEDFSTAIATFTCAIDATHVEEVNASITSNSTAATCIADGKTTYIATVTFNDKTYTATKTETIPTTGHAWGEPTYTWSEDNSSVTATRVCKNDATHVETETVNTTSKVTTPATCTEKGKTTYTATFTNPAFATQTKTVENILALGHDWGEPTYVWAEDNSTVTATRVCKNDDTHVETETVNTVSETTDPTCDGVGATTYTATFENGAFEKQTKTVEIGATGHDWGEPTYTWSDDNSSVTAARVCGNNANHIETETVNTTSEVTKSATCEAKGETTYTATFTNTAFAIQTKTVANIDALGHDWGDPKWTWAEDFSTATATFTCANDATHVETENATVTSETTDATCVADGKTVYTATVIFNGETYTDTKTETIPALGHDWGEPTWAWADDYNSATATFTCAKDSTHTQTLNASVTFNSTAPTCIAEGTTNYFATVSFNNKTYTASKTVTIPAIGHVWGNPTYTWSDDNSTVTATRVCGNNEDHVETETVNTSYDVTTAATCEIAGVGTYTATFTNTAFETQTKTVEISATGHDWGDPTYVWTKDGNDWICTAKRVCRNDPSHVEGESATAVRSERGSIATYTATFANEAFETQTKEVEIAYYLIGTMTNWIVDAAYEFAPNDAAAGEYMLGTNLEVGTELKVVRAEDEKILDWYPTGNNYTVVYATSGNVNVYFRPAGNYWNDFHEGGYIYISRLHTINIVTDGNGSASIDPASPDFTANVTLTATPNDGYHFDRTEFYKKTGEGANDLELVDLGWNNETKTFQMPDYDIVIKVFFEKHSFDAATYEWTEDNGSVTARHSCTKCSFVESETVNTTAEVTRIATCTEKGETTYTATFTNNNFETQTKTVENIPATGHAWGDPTYEWADDCSTCTAKRVCRNDASHVETETVSTTSAVTTDPTCEIDGKTTYTATFENEAFATQTKTVDNIPATGHDWNEPTYVWAEDNSSVMAKRVCCNDASHVETETVNTTSEVTKPATCEAKGETTYTATFENEAFATQTKTVDNIPATGHDWNEPTYVWAEDNSTVTAARVCKNDATHTETETVETTSEVTKPATCEAKGETTYTATFENEAFSTQTKTVENIDALGHDWNEPTYTWAEDNSAVTAKRTCEHDPSHVESETAYTEQETTAASCDQAGQVTYTATFNNPAFKAQVKTATLEAVGHDWDTPTYEWAADNNTVTATRICKRDRTHVETETVNTTTATTNPTCEVAGEKVYTATFNNPAFEPQTRTVEIPAIGHNWGTPTYEWTGDNSACTAIRTCANDSTHTETETVETTSEVTKPATCEAKGETTYTATFINPAFSTQTKTVENIDALGHDWDTPTYEWAADNSTVTAKRTCKHDPSHVETETVNSACTVTTPATCETAGVATYTATFANEAFAKQSKTAAIPATGHAWSEVSYEWANNYATCTATRVCANDEGHMETETVNSISVVTKQPTCTEMGVTTYTATFTNEAFAEQIKTVENVPTTGHSWGAPTYVWAEDNSSVTATRVCGNDTTHVETETVNTASEVTTAATCEGMGETTYMATFNNTAFETQIKTLENVDALGHDWGEPKWSWTGYETAIATFVCKNDSSHVETVDATIQSEIGTGADEGYTVFTATVIGPDGETYTDTRTKQITGTLIITRDEVAEQDFLYSVIDSENNLIVRVVLAKGKTRVKIVGLPVGTYSVKEESSWSWRYSPELNPQTAVITVQERTATVTFQEETGHMPSSEWVTDIALPNKREDGLQDED